MHANRYESICGVEYECKSVTIAKIAAVDQAREGLKMVAVLGKVACKLSEREEVVGHWNFNELNILNQGIIVDQLSTLYNIPRIRCFLQDACKVEPLKDN